MRNAAAIVHAAPAMGASFTEYTAEFESGGCLGPSPTQRFLYVLEGELQIEANPKRHHLRKGGYIYVPPGTKHTVSASVPSRAVVIEKPYQTASSTSAPRLLTGDEGSVPGLPLMGDEAVKVRTLLSAGFEFDCAVNTMTFEPGATLPMVEVHVMEHGLLMLEGGGIYRLGDRWYPVSAGDFIWMGPYCPQWFGALGKIPAKYLIYKNWNRHPLAETL